MYKLKAKGFMKPDPLPRSYISFDRRRELAQAARDNYIPEDLTDREYMEKTRKEMKEEFEEMKYVDLPDPNDVNWLAEEKRLMNEYRKMGLTPEAIKETMETNPPFGRKQKTIRKKMTAENYQTIQDMKKKVDEGFDQATTLGNRLLAIQNDLKSIDHDNKQEQAKMLGMLSRTLRETKAIEKVPLDELKKTLQTVYNRVDVPASYEGWGLKKRIIDKKEYQTNTGIVNLRLLSNAYLNPIKTEEGKGYDIEHPCKNFTTILGKQTGLPAIKLVTMMNYLSDYSRGRNYIDMERCGLINTAQKNEIEAEMKEIEDEKESKRKTSGRKKKKKRISHRI